MDDAGGMLKVVRRDRMRVRRALSALAAERERVVRAEAREEALRAELSALQRSAAWRLTFPVRKIAAAVPPSLYRRLRGGDLAGSALATTLPAPDPSPLALPASGRPRALMIDLHAPEPDRDSGSIDIFQFATGLVALGFETLFATISSDPVPGRARAGLQAAGITVLPGSAVSAIAAHGTTLELVVLNRVFCGGGLFELVCREAPGARIVFNTIDLHWVRLEREARLAGDAAGLATAAATRERELLLAREADAVVVVSERERDLIEAETADANVVVLPLARRLRPPAAPFAARSGIGFIGSFRHAPNIDALRWFLREIWPLVLRDRPQCRFSIVGADLPPTVLDGVPGRVEALGHLGDVDPWFEGLRVTVAPLRFGAGVKGKVVSSLCAGVPVVATSIASEGMGIDEAAAILADLPEAIAAGLLRVLDEQQCWDAMSAAAFRFAAGHFSTDAWTALLRAMIENLGLAEHPAGAAAPPAG